MRSLTLYGRADCELCDEMKAVIEEVAKQAALTLEVVDVSGDPRLETQYGLDVPVLLVDGVEAFRHRLTARDLRARLERPG